MSRFPVKNSVARLQELKKKIASIHFRTFFPPDQWSPINKEGKKQYDRDFLVKLAKDPLSLRKPDNLPAMDIIRDRANAGNNRMPMVNASKDWTPGFVKPTPSKSGRDRPAGPAGRRDGKPAPAVIDLKISDRDITLQKAENAWKPQNKLDGNEVTDPLAELERNVRSILNKLTPQKFETLVEKFNGLPIDTQEKLKACIELIFEKVNLQSLFVSNWHSDFVHLFFRLWTNRNFRWLTLVCVKFYGRKR